MRKVCESIIAFLEGYSAALALVMVGIVLLGVFYRYVVGQALSWYDEFAGYLLVWLTMYGSVAALGRGMHIGFDTLREHLPLGGQRVLDAFVALCVLVFSLVLLVSGWLLIRAMAEETAISIPGVKMAWVYSVLPISGALMVLASLVHLVYVFLGRNTPGIPRFRGMEEGQ